MALIKCKECEKEYSDKASQCPNCGNPTIENPNVKKKNVFTRIISIILSICIFGVLWYFIFNTFESLFESSIDASKYDTDKIYSVGDTLICPNFEIKIDKVQIKKKGTAIDSYKVIDEPEWIGVILTVKNTGERTKTFYSSNVNIVNSSGEFLDQSVWTYKIWGSEPLHSPELISGGSKSGYIQFSNTETNNSNLILNLDCDTGLFDTDIIYKVDISQ